MQSHPTRWPLPTVESGLGQGRWVQSLTVERRGQTLDLLAVIESDGKVFNLVGLSPMGQRLVRIIWENGKVWQESDPSIPIPIDGEAILRDFVFVNWPEQALAPSFLKTNWRPTFNGANRSLSWGNRSWLSVRPDTLENQVRVVVDHIVEGYKIYIITLDPEES